MASSSDSHPESAVEALFFREKFLVDDRDPLLTFSAFGEQFGILPINLDFWCQVTMLLLFQSALSVVVALIVYKFVLPRRSSPSARLLTFGVLIPFVLYVPFFLAEHLRLRNRGVLFSLTNLSTVMVFRLLEALFGTSAKGSEALLFNYCLYCASVAGVVYDDVPDPDPDRSVDEASVAAASAPCRPRPKRISRARSLRRLAVGLVQYVSVGVLLSAGRTTGYEPFRSHGLDCASFPGEHSWRELVHWGHLLNNAYAALTFFLVLSFSLTLVSAVVSLLFGCETIDTMKDPLFSSVSPSEFWGHRWNQNVQFMLKRAIYKPLRKGGFPYAAAATATFLASGVLHEFCWLVLFFRHEDCSTPGTCFEHTLGTHMAFFGWNGVVILVEFLVGGL